MKYHLVLVFISTLLLSNLTRADFEAGEVASQKGDRQTAFQAYSDAANNKDIRAYGKLASMYLYGLGTDKNYISAYAWFAMAQANGDKYSSQFKKAAASSLTRKQLIEAEKLFKQLQQRLRNDAVPNQ